MLSLLENWHVVWMLNGKGLVSNILHEKIFISLLLTLIKKVWIPVMKSLQVIISNWQPQIISKKALNCVKKFPFNLKISNYLCCAFKKNFSKFLPYSYRVPNITTLSLLMFPNFLKIYQSLEMVCLDVLKNTSNWSFKFIAV